jgi:putative chitinase
MTEMKMGREARKSLAEGREKLAERREDLFERKLFFDEVRVTLFSDSLSQDQVDGLNAQLDAWERISMVKPDADLRWLAYILATSHHESAFTHQPISEYGKGAGYSYGEPDPTTGECYYGRGLVQLTWADNYKFAGEKVHVDLYWRPELALDMPIAVRVIFFGMYEGWFTGKKLGDYIYGNVCDFVNARRIVNGTDRAETIAGYADKFQSALLVATSTAVSDHPEEE